MWTPSVWELGIILLLVFVLFGAGRLPEAFGQLGKAVKSFRDGQKGLDEPLDVTPPKKRKIPKEIEEADESEEVEEAEEIKEKRNA